MKSIIDDKFTNITNDIQRAQQKPTVYISYTGNRAFLHLTHELVNNVLDEYSNSNDISDGSFKILYDQMDNMFFIEDNGRGIPFDQLENACTILHSGTKIHREHGNTAGENGRHYAVKYGNILKQTLLIAGNFWFHQPDIYLYKYMLVKS